MTLMITVLPVHKDTKAALPECAVQEPAPQARSMMYASIGNAVMDAMFNVQGLNRPMRDYVYEVRMVTS